MQTSKDFFFCYNPKLAKHLQENGFDYITKAISPKNNLMFTLFIRNDELTKSIDKYKAKIN